MSELQSEAAARADFSAIRYAQVWEDADVLLEALDIQPGDVCVSIASAGDNALALLTTKPLPRSSRSISTRRSSRASSCAWPPIAHSPMPSCSSSLGSRPSTRRAAPLRALPPRSERRRAPVLGRATPPRSTRASAAPASSSATSRSSGTASCRSCTSQPRVQQLLDAQGPCTRGERFYDDALGHVALAGDVSRSSSRERSWDGWAAIPEFFRYVDDRCRDAHPAAHATRADRARSGRQSVHPLDSHRARTARRCRPRSARSTSTRSAPTSIA